MVAKLAKREVLILFFKEGKKEREVISSWPRKEEIAWSGVLRLRGQNDSEVGLFFRWREDLICGQTSRAGVK